MVLEDGSCQTQHFARIFPGSLASILLLHIYIYVKYRSRRPATLLKKETLGQVFSCEFCEISKNIFFTEHLQATASVSPQKPRKHCD